MAEKKGHYFPDFLIIISTSYSTMTSEPPNLHRPLASILRVKGYIFFELLLPFLASVRVLSARNQSPYPQQSIQLNSGKQLIS